ncbi:MAG TPA: sugar ABC transporter permease [Acholeplasmataceae bacterium]|nr:sugar ABC transporter permease [Acholeplasmataceae bacterium]
MTKVKEYFFSFKNKMRAGLWKFNNYLQKTMDKVKTFFVKLFRVVTFYDKREKKKEKGYQEIRQYLGITDPSISVRYDIDIVAEKQKINEKITGLSKEKELNKEEIGYLKQLLKKFPLTTKQEHRIEDVKGASRKFIRALLYLAPALIFLGIFTFYPIINAIRLVFYDGYSEVTGQAIKGYTFLGNFKKVITDANFIFPSTHTGSSALINTLLIVGISVPISIAVSLLIAASLNAIKPLKGFFQTIFFLPYVTNALAVGLVFAYIFRKDGGLFNQFLKIFGVDGGAWVGMGAVQWKAMFVLLLFQVWNTLAFKIMVFLSAIQGIDKQYYQAASIDATPRFKQFRRITAPLISPTIFYIIVTSVIGAFKSYSSVIAIFGNEGAPAGANYTMKTIVFYIYDFFNTTGKMPEAAAASLILFGFILVLTIIQMQVGKRRVHY